MHRLLAGLCALSLLAAACGADTDAQPISPSSTTTPTATTPSTATPATAPASRGDAPEEDAETTTTPPPAPTTDAAPVNVGGEVGDANVAELQAFLGAPGDDEPFYMVNLVRHRDRAVYADGRDTDLTGQQADEIYGSYMRETMLRRVGAEIVYAAQVEQDLIGGTSFDQVAVVRYPSRAEFATMTADPEFQEMLVHKQAGVADTVIMATQLIETPALPPASSVPFPATDDDPSFAFVHLFDYRDTAVYEPGDENGDDARSGQDAVALYAGNAGTVAVPLGVRPLAWFRVEATISGPLDTWEEIRINLFPSHATFDALTSDPVWQSGTHHRTAGLASTYALQTLPAINTYS